jgi:AcrR family transcriptional regulator
MIANRRAPTAPLSRELIVSTALAIVDAEGLEALSMRRLGAELGANPMAAYHHIQNKNALLDAIVEAVMSDIDVRRYSPDAPIDELIVGAAMAYRDALLAHINALPAVLARSPRTPTAMRPVESLLGMLADAGLSPTQALAGMNTIAATVLGVASMALAAQEDARSAEDNSGLTEQFPPDEFPHLWATSECPSDSLGTDFEFGIRALVAGLVGQGHNRGCAG